MCFFLRIQYGYVVRRVFLFFVEDRIAKAMMRGKMMFVFKIFDALFRSDDWI